MALGASEAVRQGDTAAKFGLLKHVSFLGFLLKSEGSASSSFSISRRLDTFGRCRGSKLGFF